MTKVRMSPDLLDYRQGMLSLVDQVRRENLAIRQAIPSVEEFDAAYPAPPELGMPGLLQPPRIESLYAYLCAEDDHLTGHILIDTSEYFGVLDVFVTLEDGCGRPLESGYALDTDDVKNSWCYFVCSSLPQEPSIVVRAMARDALGGIGLHTERVLVHNLA